MWRVVRPEAVIGSFFLTVFAFWAVGLHEQSPVFIESDTVVLGLTLAWWSLGWVMKRCGAPLFGKAWLWGSGAFVVTYVGLVLMLVFSEGG